LDLRILVADKDKNNYNFTFSDYLSMNLKMFSSTEDSDASKLILDNNSILNYFYSGNAPSYPTINFSVPIKFDISTGYITLFDNNANVINLESEFNH